MFSQRKIGAAGSRGRKAAIRMGLMATASGLSMLFAADANAQCTITGSGTVANPGSGATVNCVGGPPGNIVGTGSNTTVTVTGGSYANGFIELQGGSAAQPNTITIQGNINVSNTSLAVGDGGTLTLSDLFGTDVYSTIGDGAQVILSNNTSIQSGVGSFLLNSVTGGGSTFRLEETAAFTTTGPDGFYVIQSGAGRDLIVLNGFIDGPMDGRLVSTGGGDDRVEIGANASLGGVGPLNRRLDGGSGFDEIYLQGGGTDEFFANDFELLTIAAGPGGVRSWTNVNSYNAIKVESGVAQVTNLSVLGSSSTALLLENAGALLLTGLGANATLQQDLSGGGELYLGSSGTTLYIAGDNSNFTGTFTIGSNAAVEFDDESQAGGPGAAMVNDGVISFGTLAGTTFNLGAAITGSGDLVKTGAGVGVLGSNNSYSGDTIVQGGVLRVTGSGSLGTSAVLLASGTTLDINSGSNTTLSNNISGQGAVVKNGAGMVTLSGALTQTGGVTINQGGLRVSAFGSSAVTANAGGSLILNYNGGASIVQNAVFLTGQGSFVKEGTGTVVLGGTSTYTGGTTIFGGRLGLNNGAALGTGAITIGASGILGIGDITLSNAINGGGSVVKTASGTAHLTGANQGFAGTLVIQDGAIEVTSGAALGSGAVDVGVGTRLDVLNSTDTTIAAALQGSGALNKSGAGRLTLAGTGSTYTGDVTVGVGVLQTSGSDTLGTGAVAVSSGAVLDLRTNGSTALANVISGAGAVVKTGTGTVSLTGSNTYSGGTDIQAGALRVTNPALLGTGAVTVQSGAALDLNVASAATFNQAISGAGQLRKSGSGDLTVASNSLTGGVDIAAGRVIVSSAAAIGGGPVTTAAGTALVFDTSNPVTQSISTPISGAGGLTKTGSGELVISNTNTYNGATQILAGRLTVTNGAGMGTGAVLNNAALRIGDVTVANAISGTGSVEKTGSGTGVLSGANTYSGGTTVSAGTLQVASAGALGTGGIAVASGGTLDVANSTAASLTAALSGAGSLRKSGTGDLTLTGANTHSGGTTVTAGLLQVTSGGALGTGGVAISSGATLEVANAAAATVANTLSGAGGLRKTGTGELTLSGVNTHSGGVAVNAGTVRVTAPSALGTGAVSVASGATLEVSNAAAATYANATSGAGTLRKTGAGQLTFTSPFSIGVLTVDAGRARLNTTVTANTLLAAAGTLDGTGRLVGNLTSNGVVAPGNSIGTLTVQGNYVQNTGSVLEIEFDGAGGIDLLDVTGSATINGGTLRFVSLGGAEGSGGTFLTAAGGVTGTFQTVETVGAVLPLAVIYQPNSAIMAPSVLTARPSTFNAQTLAAADTALAFIDGVSVNAARAGEGRRAWADVIGARNTRTAAGATLGYSHSGSGGAAGFQTPVGSSLTFGAAIGGTSNDITLDSGGGDGDQTATLAAAYGQFLGDGVTITAGGLFGQIDQTARRNVTFSGFSATVSGSTGSSLYGGFVAGDFALGGSGRWTYSAGGRMSLIQQNQDAYSEGGTSPLRLSIAGLDSTTLEGRGVISARRSSADGRTRLTFDLGARYLGLEGDRSYTATFIGSGASVSLQGDTRDVSQVYAGVSGSHAVTGKASLTFGYAGYFGGAGQQEVRVGANVAF